MIFFVLLFIPMSNINLGEKSEKENRNLAKYKPLIKENGMVHYEYGKDFEKWFNDRFNLRKEALAFYSFAKFNVNANMNKDISGKFLYGQREWVFYRGDWDEMQTINHYQNIELFTQEQLEKAAAYLQSINDWCEKNNKKFYFFIAPDKHRIYNENFPLYIKKLFPDEKGKTYQLLAYLEKHTTVKVIYPYKILRERKKEDLVYWKADTHWNEMGAYWGYRSLMEAISKDFDIKPFVVTKFKTIKAQAERMNPYQEEYEYRAPDIKEYYVKRTQKRENRKDDVFLENKNGKYRIVLFRDSFSSSMLLYLGNTFRKVLASYDAMDNNLQFIKQNADIVVIETVERFTDFLDWGEVIEVGR
jgi:hypothetical protein